MEIEEILLWFSRLSLFFWTGVLIWSVGSLYLKARKEKEWLARYRPTLEGELAETDIRSYETLDVLEARKAALHRAQKRKQKA